MNIKQHIPNTITLGNMYCGFLSIGLTVHQYYGSAAALILIGMILDAFDGRVARRLNVKSEIGKQLDSLADIVTFGIAPSILFAYTNAIEGGIIDFALTGLFILCGGYRLARFNIDTSEDLSHFSGVPITAAGGLLALSTLFHAHIPAFGNIVIICVLSYLMVSTWRIPSFKHVTFPNIKTVVVILIGVILLIFDTISRFALLLTVVYLIYISYRLKLVRARRSE